MITAILKQEYYKALRAKKGQLEAGYKSGRGFRAAFSRTVGTSPLRGERVQLLKADWIDTPLGIMLAIADEKALYLLEFVDSRDLEKEVEKFRTHFTITPGKAKPIASIKEELSAYFEGTCLDFQTPVEYIGSPFQKQVWQELREIPPGRTTSYSEIARKLNHPSAFRAVARANGANRLAIIVPCHRVISVNGALAGYGGGIPRKKWLLIHEEKYGKK